MVCGPPGCLGRNTGAFLLAQAGRQAHPNVLLGVRLVQVGLGAIGEEHIRHLHPQGLGLLLQLATRRCLLALDFRQLSNGGDQPP